MTIFRKLETIRFQFIRSHLYGLMLHFFLLLAVLLLIHIWISPDWLGGRAIVWFLFVYLGVGIPISVYTGFQSSGSLKERVEHLSTMITRLSKGEFSTKLEFRQKDEVSNIATELNLLGEGLKRQKESLVRIAEEKAELARSAHKAATIEERQRLARDLHDAISQQLFALSMMAQATDRIFDKNQAKAREQLKEMAEIALQAQTEMRALLLHLRPVHLTGETLTTGLIGLLGELERKCPQEFDVDIREVKGLSKTAEEHLFRVVQEAVSNVLRHANATRLIVKLSSRNENVYLHIADDGQGFDPDSRKWNKASYGLKTMKERCEEIGGAFVIRSSEGEGTSIDVSIPKTVEEGELK